MCDLGGRVWSGTRARQARARTDRDAPLTAMAGDELRRDACELACFVCQSVGIERAAVRAAAHSAAWPECFCTSST
jgi:hypothetical protein